MRLSVLLNSTNLFLAVLVVARLDQTAENTVLIGNVTAPTDIQPMQYHPPHKSDEDNVGYYNDNSDPSPDYVDVRARGRQKRSRVKTVPPKAQKGAPKGKKPAKSTRPPSGKKPSNGKTPPKSKKPSSGKANSPYKSTPLSTSTRQRPATGRLAISQALQSFSFVTAVRHEGTLPSTNTLSYDAMVRSKIPVGLKIICGSFKFSKAAMLRAKSTQAMQNVKTMVQSAKLTKKQLDRGIAGESDLTQVIQQAIGSTANMILDAVGKPKVHWQMTNLGASPIPDIELSVAGLNSRKVEAVVELKTPISLTPNRWI